MNFAGRRKTRLQQKRLQKLEKKEAKLLEPQEPSFLSSKAQELVSPLKEKVEEKIPQKAVDKSVEMLQAAFEKSFDLVLEKGSDLIGKTCSEQKLLEQYEAFANKPLSNWELSKLGAKAAARASANMVFSTVQGGLMGVFGIGLPQQPICPMCQSSCRRYSRRCLKSRCGLDIRTTQGRSSFIRCW